MKKRLNLLLAGAFVLINFTLSAQVKNEKDWINDDPENGVYGVAATKAHDYIATKKMKIKSSPIVAIISGGIDVEHEALKESMWVNRKEKADGKDNDKNGYVDDINGWSFIGGKDGRMMEDNMNEGDREFLRLYKKYGGIFFDGKKYFRYEENSTVREYINPSEIDIEELEYYKNRVLRESRIGAAYEGYRFSDLLRDYVQRFDKMLKTKYPEKTNYNEMDFISCWDKTGEQDSLQNLSMVIIGNFFQIMQTSDWKSVVEHYSGMKQAELAYPQFEKALSQYANNNRGEVVGDNPYDIKDKSYGNGVLLTANSASATLSAGIIAGKRGVAERNNPIAPNAKIMSLNISAERGEPYLKDLALSIRYAVDNGASVILIEQQNSIYPKEQKEWVASALEYAESKGVFVVVPTHYMSDDLSVVTYYPNRLIGKKELKNLMIVSGSDKKGNPVLESNYSNKFVDAYAPAVNILSTNLGDTYQTVNGFVLAGASTAGVAALIKTYFPSLTGSQIRDILIESCTSRKGVEVEKGIILNEQSTQDLCLFEDLCVSGGILNAYNALKLAEKTVNNR